ncbi:nidogen-2 [Boleophthalmus pectinirostris]|uniref:nidogen-2 n=1 Tax=Boleophthalmus pectinirostris TaxID=150288 RepID=UPI00242CD78F|nr:nidogen-2 [Boleophthalmus pectinirostris]
MDRGQALAVWLLCCCGSLRVVTGIHRTDMFPYGSLSGDLILAEGDDETSKVLTLPRPLYFYDTSFPQLYVATNGIISAQDLPMEKQYVDDGFPTDFPVVAPFLADIDTSNGQGQIYYRVTETPSVLNRVAREVNRGFPDARFAPTHAVVATWENVAAYEDDPKKRPTNKVNTFQAVIGYDERDSYVVFLYPEDGLNFFGTRPKESYNVEIQLPARVGFSRGEVAYFVFSRTEGPHYSVTSDEQSVKNLYQVGNTGIPGVWLFHTGNRYSFNNIVPASFGGLLATSPPRGFEFVLESTTPEYAELEEYSDNNYSPDDDEEEDYPENGGDPEYPTAPVGGNPSEPVEPGVTHAPPTEDSPAPHSTEDVPVTEPSERPQVPPRQYAPPPLRKETANAPPQVPLEVVDVYPPPPSDPHLSPGGHVVNVDEDEVFDTGVIQYTTENKETCARFQQQCSQNAICSDYDTGFCCHCKSGFYGNGRQCLPDGAPQRVSGKVSGTITVGSTPVLLDHVDLHAYIVVGDGRAYTAISKVPDSIGWALMPASPIGELFGWLFALELPNSQAGFKITGAEFTRHAEVVFYPGNERLSIIQTGRGLDDQNHITVDTVVNGNVPSIPSGAEVTMDPFKEIYQYYPSVATSTSVREFSVVSADRGSESFSFQLKQNITFRDCRHDTRPTLETLQITMERVFMMYVKEERILRYAITNKISAVGVEPSGPDQVNPCYTGTHDCDTTAQCIPQEGLTFECKCATGYTGDGRNCYDIDECVESASSCGAHAQCVNLPGSHRCQCQTGYEFGFDGRTCVDIDECSSSPCNLNARCMNSLGTFHCQCHSGYYGDGFSCSQEGQTGRPKSHCEQHRDNLQSGLDHGVGAFIPQCEADGRYRPLQCHGSTGHCWCVDNSGQEKPGTRTPPGTSPTDCSRPDEPGRHKTQCEHHRDSVQTTSPEGYPITGVFVPQCDANGQYISLQCHGSTGHCWCVDGTGQERPGTRTSPGSPPADCSKPILPGRLKTHCEHHRDSVQTTSPEGYEILGVYVPQCDLEGQYVPQQCHGSTGYCWCVDSTGQEKPGTRTPPGASPHNCSHPEGPVRPKTHCEHHRDSVQTTSPEGYPILGAFVPECDANGQYTPQQCHGSTGHCWCVDSSGQERPGTRTPPGTPSVDCDRPVVPEHPKTQCEHHRDSIQTTSPEGYPITGAYVPQCDANGAYLPQQCHGSIGYCWCVDSLGQERPGTRTGPGTSSVDCSKPDESARPKTHCEHHRDSVQTTSPEGYPILGAYVPQCDGNGQYNPLQCHGSTGHCWCVDSTGQERPGTRTPPGSPPVDCDRPVEPTRPKTHCEHHRDSAQTTTPEGHPAIGAYVPQCDENGQYLSQQCHGSTGHCWCVDSTGQERPDTRSSPGSPRVDCDRPVEPTHPKTLCEHHRDSVQTTTPEGHPVVGAYVPQCDENGQYLPKQCHGSTGHCWCVDSTGQEKPGTRSSPGTPRVNCEQAVEPTRPKTHCEHHRDSVQTTSPEGHPVVGAYVPQCDENGQYLSQQCHGSTGHCWCVDSTGQERSGTRTSPGTPRVDCDRPVEPTRPKTHCEHHRDNVQTTSPEGHPVVGAYVPQCDENGQYLSQQCHGSTGHCWCVDSTGQERPGTRSSPGSPRVDCDRPVEPTRPKTHCEHHRDSVQTTTPEGQPLVGAYIPQCDENGQYLSQQCHGSTGHCWCVDSTGQERSGTRSSPGSPRVDCSKPDQPQRPKTYCEHHRDSVQTTSPEGYPILKAYVPQCDEEGQYIPQQCDGSTGHCWCVDSTGQEKAGSRTGPGVTPKDCSKPVEQTHCEYHRDSVQSNSGGRPMIGAYVPQCDADGQYLPKQCHGSSGHCWCVDINGRERAGTRTPPGSPPIDCNRPVPVAPTQRPESVCERWRASLIEHYGGKPEPQQYLPQCEPDGQFSPVQCYGETTYCWCVDQDGREVPGTRSHDVVKPACLPSVAPPTVRPIPRPNVTPPPDAEVTLLYAQGQKIGALPLDGTKLDTNRSKTLLTLHGSIVVGIAYDCKENQVYWTDLSARTINRAMLPGAEPEILIGSNLVSPEGLAVDSQRRRMFWVDSSPDLIETSNLDGTGRRTLFDTNLVNPRAIIVVPSSGTLYWTDWNREAPKIETASVEGKNRRVVVSDGIGLPNALTYDSSTGQVCWADAGTKRLECIYPDGSGRKVVHPNLNYPFSMVYYRQHFYYTDWRRDGVITVNKETNKLTDEYLPEQRSHLYGIAIASTQCLSGIH